MQRLIIASTRVRQATGLAAVLDAACDAFEQILVAIAVVEDATDCLVVPLLLADRLAQAAAAAWADRAACLDAAAHARRIHDLLAGDRP